MSRARSTRDGDGTSVPERPGASGGPRPRALFYSHDGYGLGHIRIVLAVAGALAARRPDAALLVLTGSPQTHAYDLPPHLDYVKLPAVAKRQLYRDVPVSTAAPDELRGVWSLRGALILATARVFVPNLVVVDHQPTGLAREMVPALDALRTARPRPERILLLRDVDQDPATTRAAWLEDGAYDLLDRAYDRILVYGSRDVFDPVREYGFSPAAAAKTTFCGYIRPPEPVVPAERVRERLGVGAGRLVVVTAGGGADGGPLLRAYLAALHGATADRLTSLVVAGPLLAEAERTELEAAAEGLPGVVLVPFCRDLVSHLNAADLVVTMGGYNAVAEAVSLGRRTIVVPRGSGAQEQVLRAEGFARLGLVTMLHPDDATPERLRHTVRHELQRCTTPAPVLDFGGLERIGDVLAAVLEP